MTPVSSSRIDARMRAVGSGAPDQRSAKIALLVEIGSVVPFDGYVWVSTDPETEVGSSPLADVPIPIANLPELIRLKYQTRINRWTVLDAPAAGLVLSSDGDESRSAMWRELLSSYGVVDVASLVFRDAYGCWGFLDLWRVGPHAPFSRTEVTDLASLCGVLTESLRRSLAPTFAEPSSQTPPGGPLVIVLSPSLHVRAQTPQTQAVLDQLVPDASVAAAVPAGALNVAAQFLARSAGVDSHPPWARVHLPKGPWLTLRASPIEFSDPDVTSGVVVTAETSTPAERLDLFGRVFGLTAREAELLQHMRDGADTRQIAERMFVAELTVQDHLKAIFRKTGSHSRAALLARAVGQ